MTNVTFALLIAGVVALGRGQRTERALGAAANPATRRAQVSTDELVRELSDIGDITDVAGELSQIPAADRPEECWDDAFEYLDAIRWSLANYVLRGDRTRRLVNAPNLFAELADDSGDDLSLAACTLRARADELAEQVLYTNAVVSDWLVTHRIAVVNPCYLDSNTLFDRCRLGQLDPTSIAEDPLYLLICHLHDVLEAVEHAGDVEIPGLEHVSAQLTLPLRAVQQEVAAAMAYGAAAIGVTRAVARAKAT